MSWNIEDSEDGMTPSQNMRMQLDQLNAMPDIVQMRAKLLTLLPSIREAADVIIAACTHEELIEARPGMYISSGTRIDSS